MTDLSQSATAKVRRWLWLIIGLIVLVLISPFVVTAIMLYGTKSTNQFTDQMTKWFPYPAATVGSDWILYRDFKQSASDAISATKQLAGDQALVADVGALPTDSEIAQEEYDRLISVAVLEQIAQERNLTASEEEIETIYQQQVLSQVQGDESQITATLQELYGWTVAEFKQEVIRELVLRQKLQEALLTESNSEFTAPALSRLQQIQTEALADPTKFSDLAQQYSEDSSATLGGDLGWFERGVMVQPFEEAAFALTEPNQITDIVQSQFGYHLIQLIERKAATETEPEQVRVRHILIQYSLDDYLDRQISARPVRRLIDSALATK